MKLIKNDYDYYDSLARDRNLSDPNYVFHRETREIEDVEIGLYQVDCRLKNTNVDVVVDFEVVGFCGKIYPMLRVTESVVDMYSMEKPPKFYYNFESFSNDYPDGKLVKRKHVWQMFELEDFKIWFKTGIIKRWSGVEVSCFDNVHLKRIFTQEKAAYFHGVRLRRGHCGRVTVYPVLKKIKFFKVFDAYSCFVALENYISNELAPRDEIITEPVPDKINAESHGFDKFSFRKEKGKKKRGKKNEKHD